MMKTSSAPKLPMKPRPPSPQTSEKLTPFMSQLSLWEAWIDESWAAVGAAKRSPRNRVNGTVLFMDEAGGGRGEEKAERGGERGGMDL